MEGKSHYYNISSINLHMVIKILIFQIHRKIMWIDKSYLNDYTWKKIKTNNVDNNLSALVVVDDTFPNHNCKNTTFLPSFPLHDLT